MRTLVLIGPAAVGKSTVGEQLGALLRVPFVDLDEIAARYYDECEAPVSALIERAHAVGFLADQDWVIEGVDLLREWVHSEQNQQLADLTVVTVGRTPMEVAEAIVAALG